MRVDQETEEQDRRTAERLLAWFAEQARDLPWRRDRDPYRVWIAEAMLQQTRAETVVPYYLRFLQRFPDLPTLAKAPLEEVLKAWEGLGYYARARNLHAAARRLVEENDGRLPSTFEGLIALPGFGPYTAGAVASIAFGEAVPAVDGNARRVLCRLFAVEGDTRRASVRRRLEDLARRLLPPDRPGPFNEALMELGATVCLPRSPHCDRCPVSDRCQAHQIGRETAYPSHAPRRTVPHYHVTAGVLVQEDGRVLVTRRPEKGFLGGLWEFPGGKQEPGETLTECLTRELREELGIEVEVGEHIISLDHAYTHFRVTLHAFRCRLRDGQPRCLQCADLRWVVPGRLEALPMAVTDRRIARALQEPPGAARRPWPERSEDGP